MIYPVKSYSVKLFLKCCRHFFLSLQTRIVCLPEHLFWADIRLLIPGSHFDPFSRPQIKYGHFSNGYLSPRFASELVRGPFSYEESGHYMPFVIGAYRFPPIGTKKNSSASLPNSGIHFI